MRAMLTTTALGVLALGLAEAAAQGANEVPIGRDLRRMERLDQRLGRGRPVPVDPNVTPDNPDGVVGFDGAPDMFDDDIEDDGPMPPGSPADIDD
ncbi:hypothetical protein [uncultured Methylobacterium sp.]|jgi:hypothetical protein|uniref:hypothetical protein n=1 Tax=uncultured Methylobacterium sp. TaxID=157278 RepID=UPI002627E71F|nr:hypothetical protein [uncultured Methylobacterium sp.]